MQTPFLVPTADGSLTLFQSEVGEHYHSKHGALQESKHVFLNSGLVYFLAQEPQTQVRILEVGLGTGLNFLLTADYAQKQNLPASRANHLRRRLYSKRFHQNQHKHQH
jgi:tRNA U34 5-methylaminomethyl-2-thiouridine-forming methyltransferase MnmC